ncbi:MAG: ankyrin repeat domain-containing protein [Acidobacteriota bacterium]
MDARELPARPSLTQYEKLAEDVVNAYNSGDSDALQRIKEHYAFERPLTLEELRARIAQRLRGLRGSENQSADFALGDAQDLIADSHCFENWFTFSGYIHAINTENSPDSQFEAAVDAVVSGDVATLERLLHENPELIRARSAREHGATLLHYVAANGVEDFRQKTPKNAVEIAETLLKAGAEVDADLAYGSSLSVRTRYPERVGSTTLGLVATSIHPAHAGVQIALMESLLDAGAALDGIRGGWGFVNGCLANGRPEAAHFLARRGARLDLESAAGVGRLDIVQSFFNEDGSLKPTATKAQMESGFMWACEYGHTRVAEFLLDINQGGLDVGTKAHGMTGLHWAMVGGRLDTIKFLLERKAPLESENNYGGTVLGCAIWAVGQSDPVYRWPDSDTDWLAIVQMLVDAGAKVYETDSDFPTGNERVDELLRRHGMKP